MARQIYPEGTIAVMRIEHEKQRDPEATIARALEFLLDNGIAFSPAPGNLEHERSRTDFFVRRCLLVENIEQVRDLLPGYFVEFTERGPWYIHVRRPYNPREGAGRD